jgi:chromosome partitioning protein
VSVLKGDWPNGRRLRESAASGRSARSAILASDVVVVPVQPSPLDIWAAEKVVKLIEEARVCKQNLKACFAINRKIANTAIGRDVRKALTTQASVRVLLP